MRLQKRLSRRYKDRKYHKYLVVIPEKEIKNSGFREGEELKVETKKGEIKIKRK